MIQGAHILVIDDEPALLALFEDALTDEGYRITTLTTAPEPADVARIAPDLLLVDYRLGSDGNGAALLTRLHADPATTAIPVILCTAAFATSEELGPPWNAWIAALVRKPFDLEVLSAAIAAILADTTEAAT